MLEKDQDVESTMIMASGGREPVGLFLLSGSFPHSHNAALKYHYKRYLP